MIGLEQYVGQTLDEKYLLERLLGRGGMGAVYLATHLGTERYVALKLIAPQFMRNEEFVERFKREARAAGRLRHPNVVDVTDFGFARVQSEPVAYLVMEYLDGCTLGDVLIEEKRLPLEWVVDILEQVCSALDEAHQQGIVHRDLKPDNIWLEPNRLGGYRVKVLDFGIAKLAEVTTAGVEAEAQPPADLVASAAAPTEEATLARPLTMPHAARDSETVLFDAEARLNKVEVNQLDAEASTLLFDHVLPDARIKDDGDRTLLLDQKTHHQHHPVTRAPDLTSHSTELTRVGAIMGTPLYMSPEQCWGRDLDARADIYSLGVIAYQMLAGEPPFTGDMSTIIAAHRDRQPQALSERARKIPKRVARVVMSALAKDPADRPQSAAAFANSLRAQAEGIGSLYRRAFALYSEYFPKFLRLSLIAHLPVIVATLLLVALELGENALTNHGIALKVFFFAAVTLCALLQIVSYFVAASAISGVTAVIVTQLAAAPLKPVELRIGFDLLRRRWKPFLKTSLLITLRILLGFCLFIIPGLVMYVRYALYAPVVLIEGLEKKAARLRARELASRSWRTVIAISVLQILIPMTVRFLLGRFNIDLDKPSGGGIHVKTGIYQQLSGLVNIFIVPLMSIVPALLYLKMRQLGGESLSAALAQIEEANPVRSKWQQRMRSRIGLTTGRGQRSLNPTTNEPSSQ